MPLTRRNLLAGIAASLPLSVYGAGIERPPARAGRVVPPAGFEQIFAQSGLGQKSGCVLLDLESGQVAERHNPDLARPPASVVKAVTALYAQAKLGSGHRFNTDLVATGPISEGTLQGDLYLVGGGDPQLDADGLNRLAIAARAAGLRRMTGRFYVVGNALPLIERIDRDQPVQAGYNPAIAGINLNYNRIFFEWKRRSGQYSTSLEARAAKVRPAVRCASMSISERVAPIYSYARSGGVERWSVARAALGNGGGRWLPVRDPAAYAADVFQTLAGMQGITLPLGAQSERLVRGTVVARLQSDPLDKLLAGMLRYSTNLTAEVLGLSATRAAAGGTASLRASAQSMGRWVAQQVPGSSPGFFNHSGLTDKSRISAQEMVRFLAMPGAQSGLAGILHEVELQNPRGDGVEIPGVKVLAKSGTLNFTRGLAGYIMKNNAPRYAFAIFAADMAARRAALPSEERPAGASRWRGVARAQEKALVYRWASAV